MQSLQIILANGRPLGGPNNPLGIEIVAAKATPKVWTLTVVALGGGSQQALAAKAERRAVRIHNPAGNGPIYYRLDGGAVTTANGFPIPADGQDLLDDGDAGVAALTVRGTSGQSLNVWEAV